MSAPAHPPDEWVFFARRQSQNPRQFAYQAKGNLNVIIAWRYHEPLHKRANVLAGLQASILMFGRREEPIETLAVLQRHKESGRFFRVVQRPRLGAV